MLSSRAAEAIQLLRHLIATPSPSRQEGAAADIVEQFLLAKGAHPHRHCNNVWALEPADEDDTRPILLLNAHLDTVKPVSGWLHDPFTPTLEGDRLYGLGSNDCGGGLVALMQAALPCLCGTAPDTERPWRILFAASAEEEVSGRQGIESLLPLLPQPSAAIIGEPTGLQPATSEKGLMVVDAVCHGKAGHAARNEGDNAIYHALQDLDLLANHCAELFPDISPQLGPVRATVTIISAGTQHNVVPDRCTYTIDVRSTDRYSNEQILSILRQHLCATLTPRSTHLQPSHIPNDHPLVRRCLQLGLKPFGSPTLSDQALMRFPSLKLGPGESARSHTADEFICLTEIEQAINLYDLLLTGP